MTGSVYNFTGRVDENTIMIERTDRVSINDVVFVIGKNNEDDKHGGGNHTTQLFLVSAVDIQKEHKHVMVVPFLEDSEDMLPDEITMVGWISANSDDTVGDAMKLVDIVVEQHERTNRPAAFYMPGIAGPIQPIHYEDFDTFCVKNISVIVRGEANLVLDRDCYGIPFENGGFIEMQLGVPKECEELYHYPIIENTTRYEVRYCHPGEMCPPHWESIVWTHIIGRLVEEVAHPMFNCCSIIMSQPHAYSETNKL